MKYGIHSMLTQICNIIGSLFFFYITYTIEFWHFFGRIFLYTILPLLFNLRILEFGILHDDEDWADQHFKKE